MFSFKNKELEELRNKVSNLEKSLNDTNSKLDTCNEEIIKVKQQLTDVVGALKSIYELISSLIKTQF